MSQPENDQPAPKIDPAPEEPPVQFSQVAVDPETGESTPINLEPEPDEKQESEADVSEAQPKKEGEKEGPGYSDFLKKKGINVEEIASKTPEKVAPKKDVELPKGRDYTGLTDEERVMFKEMNNVSFNKLKPIYLEHNKLKADFEALKKQTPIKEAASVYGHPKAFLLTPEYQTKSTEYNKAEAVRQHWQLQASRVSRGEKWEDLDQDPKTGHFVKSEFKDASADAEALIANNLHFAREQSFDMNKDLKGYIENYGKSYEADVQSLKHEAEQYFPDYDKPDHPTAQVQKAVMDAIPASFKNHPLASLLAKTAANNAIFLGKWKAALKEIDKLKGIKSDTTNAQPRSKDFLGGGERAKKSIGYSDFIARKNGA